MQRTRMWWIADPAIRTPLIGLILGLAVTEGGMWALGLGLPWWPLAFFPILTVNGIRQRLARTNARAR